MGWQLLIGIGLALVAAWLVLISFLFLARPSGSRLAESIRILPDVLRLLRRLAADRSLPRPARVRLWLLFGYLALPIDLVPDFLPVIGYADDVIIVGAVLRSIVRRAGPELISRRWPGTPEGLAVVRRLAGLTDEELPRP
jgi:uncharacterized membrane protein YkvA (DUF1232 family)